MHEIRNTTHLNRWYSAIVLLMPILNIYSAGISSLGIGDILGVIIILCLLVSNRGKLQISEKRYAGFALMLIVVSFVLTCVISEYSLMQFALKAARFIVYTTIIICFGKDRFDVEFGVNLYISITVLAACYLIIQFVLKTYYSISLPITIPYLKILYSESTGAVYNEELLQMYSIFGYRAPGFFKEPSHFCQYAAPSIAILLFKSARAVKRNIAIVIIAAAIIISYSAIGYICLMATVIIWFIYTFKERRLFNNIVFMIIGSVALVYISIRTGAFSSALSRINTINYSHAATGNLRLLRGFYVYHELPTLFKFVGIGIGNYSQFIDKYGIQTFFDNLIDKHVEYMNVISCVLVNSGVIGLGLYISALFDIYKKTTLVQKVLFVNFVVLIIATSSFFSATYVMYMVFLIANISANIERDCTNKR